MPSASDNTARVVTTGVDRSDRQPSRQSTTNQDFIGVFSRNGCGRDSDRSAKPERTVSMIVTSQKRAYTRMPEDRAARDRGKGVAHAGAEPIAKPWWIGAQKADVDSIRERASDLVGAHAGPRRGATRRPSMAATSAARRRRSPDRTRWPAAVKRWYDPRRGSSPARRSVSSATSPSSISRAR